MVFRDYEMNHLNRKWYNLFHILKIILIALAFLQAVQVKGRTPFHNLNHNVHPSNPYQILGLSPNATEEEIKKAYRTQCLKYHPDKHVNKSIVEQQQNEQKFKEIQDAYSRIGTKEARRMYNNNVRNGNFPYDQDSDATRRYEYASRTDTHVYEYDRASGYSYTRPKMAFYVNGVDVSHFFHSSSSSLPFGFSSSPWKATMDDFFFPTTNGRRSSTTTFPRDTSSSSSSSKSIYIQTVRVPLQELYSGVTHKPFVLQDNLWTRYQAAHRGGILHQHILTSLWTTLPFFFRSILFSLRQRQRPLASFLKSFIPFIITSVLYLNYKIPRPHRTTYYANVQKGWKSGTKLKFQNVSSNIDVIFILEEEEDERYQRVGDDLKMCLKLKEEDLWKSIMVEGKGDDDKMYHGIDPHMQQQSNSTSTNTTTIWIDSLDLNQNHKGAIPLQIPFNPNSIQNMLQQTKPSPFIFNTIIKDKGWPKPKERGGGYGNLLVTVQIVPSERKMRRKDWNHWSKCRRMKTKKEKTKKEHQEGDTKL